MTMVKCKHSMYDLIKERFVDVWQQTVSHYSYVMIEGKRDVAWKEKRRINICLQMYLANYHVHALFIVFIRYYDNIKCIPCF